MAFAKYLGKSEQAVNLSIINPQTDIQTNDNDSTIYC